MASTNNHPATLIEVETLARQWQNGLHINHTCHSRMTAKLEHRARYISIATITLSTIVGTAIFASLAQSPAQWAKILTGTLSIATAILAAFNASLGYSQLAERHREAAVKYGALRRKFEEVVATVPATDLPTLLATVRSEWDHIDAIVPSIPQLIYDRISRRIVATHTIKHTVSE